MEIELFRQVSPGSRRKRRGIALILVLACVVLLTVMVLAFLVSISGEVQSSKFYANGSSVKLLAQSATDLVMAEIRDATSNGSLCWASQPGMIRTWDNTGKAVNYYKLYSDASMVTPTFDHTKSSLLVPDGKNGSIAWYNQKGVYVDLNQPVSVNGVNQYPIIDGDFNDYYFTAFTAGSNTTTPIPPLMTWQTVPSASVEVLNGQTVPTGLPNGFWLNSDTPSKTFSSANSQAPMPVKWLYVLRDGSIAVPATDLATSTTVSFLTKDPVTNDTLPTPTSTNPIVGRMAFWTDDETCKVNINTASEGTYWDIPRSQSPGDGTLALNSPTYGEFQRYPGHPAMTSLGTVFNLPTPAATVTSPDPAESIYSITPRLGFGGSEEGRVKTTQGAATTITLNSNRLYATTDEYVFQPSRATNNSLTGISALDQVSLKDARFFITASSRAPDVNLFNQPRISIWPISISSGAITHSMSPYDKLLAFCSTMRTDLANPYLYYFQRNDPTDNLADLPTTNDNAGLDRNRRLLEYLRYLTTQNIPGFGGNFASKYSISNGASTNPGTDRDQILTEIFDYIRSTNLGDPSVPNSDPYTFVVSAVNYNGTPAKNAGNGKGQVVPIEDTTTTTRGFGRFRTIQGATLVFIANADGDVAASQPSTNPVAAGSVRIQMCILPQFFDPSPGSIFDTPSFDFKITGMDGLGMASTSAGPFTSAGLTSSYSAHQAYYALDNCFWGDQLGFKQILSSSFVGTATVDVPKAAGTFAFSGATVTISLMTPTNSAAYMGASCTNPGTVVQTATLTFPAGTFPLPTLAPSNVYDYQYATSVGTGPYNMRYFNPPPTLKTPNTIPNGPDLAGNNSPSLGGRLAAPALSAPYVWFTKYDVVRSVAVASDPRLVAAQKNPPASLYSPVGPYNSGTGNSATPVLGTHSFFDGSELVFYGAVVGKLVASDNYDNNGAGTTTMSQNGLLYAASGSTGAGGTIAAGQPGGRGDLRGYYNTADCFDPATGVAINGVAMGKTASFAAGNVLGDWDSGISIMRDGAFINKADEGDKGVANVNNVAGNWGTPYGWKGRIGFGALTSGLFTPNRMIPSAVMFGSLPTGVFANKPWQTLLFRPGPIGHMGLGTSVTTPNTPTTTYGSDQGPPYTTIPDHLILDLFSMPVVEPYAISEPLSTAGRINMNHLIVPFTYINRDTGLRAVLASEQVVSISDSLATNYKYGGGSTTNVIRFPVNLDSTLSQFFTRRFNNGDIFRSPSEICDIDIVPSNFSNGLPTGGTAVGDPNPVSAAASLNPTRLAMDTYWNTASASGHRLTGDNSRERIYATLYPRLTTKSNTFTIHFRVQTLKPAPGAGSDPTKWREGTDVVTAEYRGSQMIERYIDPNDTSIPDFAASPSITQTLAPYYKFRVLSVKQFAP